MFPGCLLLVCCIFAGVLCSRRGEGETLCDVVAAFLRGTRERTAEDEEGEEGVRTFYSTVELSETANTTLTSKADWDQALADQRAAEQGAGTTPSGR